MQMDTTSKALSKHTSMASTRAPRRLRSVAEKRAIVEETLEPGASVSMVARRHDVNANLVFGWRKLYSAGGLRNTASAPAARLVRVRTKKAARPNADAPPLLDASATAIEIVLPKGRIRLQGAVNGSLLRAVIEALA
jgi:transposase